MTPGSAAQREAASAGRFQPGELVAGRYRIVALLGRGGMGEVYRADDLRLEQSVALKFLRAEIVADSAARARFLAEVKLARSVTHANVCRVHDLGEVDGLLYLSMEYVDGEDLAALLRRIGAPGEKKALEIAGQLCAGLAAAHGKGVLHRDLKPANVMIDGAGKVRITDFGLATLEENERERGVVAGTPAYMAPEQLAGGEATARSDVYALGLVLYELFTGVRVWSADDLGQLRNLHATRAPDPPSKHARALDEPIERAILACLERDPARRPRSPTSVAAALTGADPIAAALAAGETPTPEMVAASGGEGTISMAAAGVALAAILALFAAMVFVEPHASEYGHLALGEPTVLAYQAREILQHVGLAVPDGDRASGFHHRWRKHHDEWQLEAEFWYREAPFSLQPSSSDLGVWSDDPPLHWPGMVSLGLSTSGKLTWLEAVPPTWQDPTRSEAHCDWKPFFDAAGLVRADFKPLDPGFMPFEGSDERSAWSGPYPGEPGRELQVGGASFQGRPVFFALVPWTARPDPRYLPGSDLADLIQFWLWWLAAIGGSALAWRNLSNRRGDRRTATSLALVVVLLQLCQWLLRANHTTNLLLEGTLLESGLATALYTGGIAWVLYMGLEPYVRRIWPDRMVSWSRLFAGRWRDPLVARDLMAGLGAGLLASLAYFVQVWIGLRLHAPGADPITENFPGTAGLRWAIAHLCVDASDGLKLSLALLFSLVALRFFVRRNWIAYLLFAPVVFAKGNASLTGMPVLDYAALVFFAVVLLFLVARCGLFALAVFIATFGFLNEIPLTSEMSAWYAGQTIFAGLVVGGLALAAARFATGKKVPYADAERTAAEPSALRDDRAVDAARIGRSKPRRRLAVALVLIVVALTGATIAWNRFRGRPSEKDPSATAAVATGGFTADEIRDLAAGTLKGGPARLLQWMKPELELRPTIARKHLGTYRTNARVVMPPGLEDDDLVASAEWEVCVEGGSWTFLATNEFRLHGMPGGNFATKGMTGSLELLLKDYLDRGSIELVHRATLRLRHAPREGGEESEGTTALYTDRRVISLRDDYAADYPEAVDDPKLDETMRAMVTPRKVRYQGAGSRPSGERTISLNVWLGAPAVPIPVAAEIDLLDPSRGAVCATADFQEGAFEFDLPEDKEHSHELSHEHSVTFVIAAMTPEEEARLLHDFESGDLKEVRLVFRPSRRVALETTNFDRYWAGTLEATVPLVHDP